jgi:alanine racemase
MPRPTLTIDLGAIAENWRALAALSGSAEAGAVIKADAYGLGAAGVGPVLRDAGARTFFVAQAEEGAALRDAVGPAPAIYVFNGFIADEAPLFLGADLRPCLNTPQQITAYAALSSRQPDRLRAALHVDSGINRLGLGVDDLNHLLQVPENTLKIHVDLILSHLACADDPENPMNAAQASIFRARAQRARLLAPKARLSLSATGGVMLGADFAFDLTRPGVGLYGGLPFADARTAVSLHAPILQVRDISTGEAVGYGASWRAPRPSRIAVVPLGYADGIMRAMSGRGVFWLDGEPVPIVGRVSMDMITLDVTDRPDAATGQLVEVLGPNQSVDALAAYADTIGYEVLTALGARYQRRYIGGA